MGADVRPGLCGRVGEAWSGNRIGLVPVREAAAEWSGLGDELGLDQC